jgi:hypothetical protein
MLAVWKSKIKSPPDLVAVEGPFLVAKMCPHMAEGAKNVSGVSFIKALIPFMCLQHLYLITFQSPHFLITSHGGLEFQHLNLGKVSVH